MPHETRVVTVANTKPNNAMNELIALTGKTPEVSLSAEAQKLKVKLLKESKLIGFVDSDEKETQALSVLSSLAGYRRMVDASHKATKAPVLDLGRRIDGLKNDTLKEIEAEEFRIKKNMEKRIMEKEQEKRRLEREAQELREKAAKEAADAEIARQKAEKSGSVIQELKAEKLEAQRIETLQEASYTRQEASQSKVKGSSVVLDFRVTDIHALYKSNPRLVKLEEKRRELLEHLNLMKENGETPSLPGIEVFESVRVRS